jgi:uncharacterized membrane protein
MASDATGAMNLAVLGLTPLDLVAIAWFTLCTVGYNLLTSARGIWRLSLVGAIQGHRMAWMSHMAHRSDRVIDVLLISSLAAGNSFFASTSIVLLGALSALLGSGERAQAILDRIPFAEHASPVAWDLKVLVLMIVFVYAFFKFAWAFRLAHYSMIMMGATPPATTGEASVREALAERAGRVAGLAAEHGNLGLRSYYFAMAGLAWFIHPLAFIVATTLVVLIVTRREFFSRTLSIVSNDPTTTISMLPRI